jgi:hypothetical protein
MIAAKIVAIMHGMLRMSVTRAILSLSESASVHSVNLGNKLISVTTHIQCVK